jgi:predicted dehydrogenase
VKSGPPHAADTVRIGVVGAGFVAQVVHLPHLRDAGGRFRVVAVAEPDAGVRDAVAAQYGVRAFDSHEELLAAADCDAVLVCSPNATHADVVIAALEAGRHVLVEKPLCLSLEDADRIVAARDRAGLVVQVAYMKRFDPAYEALLEDLVAGGDVLAYVSTVTVDPGLADHFGPYVSPASMRGRAGAGNGDRAGEGDRLLSDAFMGALVHDVNAVHGLLGALGVRCDEALVVDGFGHPDGSLAGGTTVLPGGLRWTMAWTHLPRAGTFDERIELLGSHGVRRLEFPAPYLRQSPTSYTWIRRGPQGCVQRTFRSWREAYARQLEHFHACVTAGAACRTPPEQARADIGLLAAMHDATLLVAA